MFYPLGVHIAAPMQKPDINAAEIRVEMQLTLLGKPKVRNNMTTAAEMTVMGRCARLSPDQDHI